MQPHLALGLFFALASTAAATPAASAPGDFSSAEQVRVSLSSFQIAPGALHLKAGQPVILTITNEGFGRHDLTAPEFFAAAAIRAGDEKAINKGIVRVRAGEKAVIALVPAPGHYLMKCSHAFHKMLGMHGSIDVAW